MKKREREREREKKTAKRKNVGFYFETEKKNFFFFTQKRHIPTEIFSLCCLGFFLNRSLDKKGKKTAPLSLPLSKPPAVRARGSSAAAEGPAP